MRIFLHAGLHKSGTTAIQAEWRDAFGEPGEVWYPRPDRGGPGHAQLFWPSMRAFTDEEAPDLVLPRRRRSWKDTTSGLRAVITEAQAHGTEVLVLSTEELDRLQASDLPSLREALGPHEITVLLTVTRPVHRWCSGWQELVKHGLGTYPDDAAEHVTRFASLAPGRLAQLVELLPSAHTLIRLVRPDPPEPDLAARVAQLLDLPGADRMASSPPRNRSIGTDIEIVRRLNQADLGLGTLELASRELLERLRREGLTYREDPGLADRYRVPSGVVEVAREERAFLEAGPGNSLTVSDPHDQLSHWEDATLPAWYSSISKREAEVPWLRDDHDASEQLWRARQERSALRMRLERAERRLARMRSGMSADE